MLEQTWANYFKNLQGPYSGLSSQQARPGHALLQLQLEDFANCPGVSCQAMPAMHKAQNAKHGGANLWKISMVFDMNAVSQFFFQCRWVITQKKGGAFKLAIIQLSDSFKVEVYPHVLQQTPARNAPISVVYWTNYWRDCSSSWRTALVLVNTLLAATNANRKTTENFPDISPYCPGLNGMEFGNYVCFSTLLQMTSIDDISSIISRFPTSLSLLELAKFANNEEYYDKLCGLKMVKSLPQALPFAITYGCDAPGAGRWPGRNGAEGLSRELDRMRSWALLPRLLDCWTSNVKVTGSKSSQIKNRGWNILKHI